MSDRQRSLPGAGLAALPGRKTKRLVSAGAIFLPYLGLPPQPKVFSALRASGLLKPHFTTFANRSAELSSKPSV